jgi:hypothetical protein
MTGYFGDDADITVIRRLNNSSPARGSRRRCGATAGPSQTVEGHPPVGAISWSCSVETQRQYNLAQRREDKKKVLARSVIGQSYFGDDAPVTVIARSANGGDWVDNVLAAFLQNEAAIASSTHNQAWSALPAF